MAEENNDPREVSWHPRFARNVLGHEDAENMFMAGFASGRPHHAWLITGPMGIGKATLAYALAQKVLAQTMPAAQVERWLQGRAHPDMAVLERSFNDAKPRKLRMEISVEDARRFIDFFARTSSSGGWRIGLVDCADDLNNESGSALLKLIEEPPAKALIFLVCTAPGRILRTLRSRCRNLPLAPLPLETCAQVLQALPQEAVSDHTKLEMAAALSGGSPGFALRLLESQGAKAFAMFANAKRVDAPLRNSIGQHFATRALAAQEYEIFMGLLLDWLATKSKASQGTSLAALHQELAQQSAIVAGYNLDRRVAVMESLSRIDLALKAA